MRRLTVSLLAITTLAVVSHVQGAPLSKIYGVQSSQLNYFKKAEAAKKFTCLDGSGQKDMDISFVNDNFCDCADGSDEPGTSACSYYVQFPKEWRFQCGTPIGGRYRELFHSRVNDGICDCCDGSDEYDSSKKCEDNCAEAAEREEREAREREARRQAGLTAKKALLEKGQALIEQNKKELETAQLELQQAERDLAPLEETKNKEEELERLHREEIKAKSLQEKEVWEAEQAKKKEAEELADVERKAAANANPEIERVAEDSESSRYVCSKWRQTTECKGDGKRDDTADKDCDVTIQSGWSGYCECFDAKEGVEVKHAFNCAHATLTCDYVCEHNGETGTGKEDLPGGSGDEDKPEEPQFKVDEGLDYFRPEANDARSAHNAVNTKKIDAQNKVNSLEETMKAAYYEYPALLALKDECLHTDAGSYSYHMCFFKNVHQGPRGSNHGSTNMGNFEGFGEQTYGSWGGKHDISKMKYTRGQHCYGGPDRSVEVSVRCGPENKLVSVDEPSMCTYKMVVDTPAVCE